MADELNLTPLSVAAIIVGLAMPVTAAAAPTKPCTLGATHATMRASTPPAWLSGEEQKGACEMDRRGQLPRQRGAALTVKLGQSPDGPFTVSLVGPQGSGRTWSVGVSFQSPAGLRGFCFLTSTVGWRHVGGNDALAGRRLRN
ncbi:MAG TPA: hypothetical protein VKQ32_24560 [Polyangia bacterium]|nr:hypothetical protein [Polyangia bacterium]